MCLDFLVLVAVPRLEDLEFEDVMEVGTAGWLGEPVPLPFCVVLELRRRLLNGESIEELLEFDEVGAAASDGKMSSGGSFIAASTIIFAVVCMSSETS